MKTLLVLKSSPRKNGNSAILADQVATGARDSGAQVEIISLHDMNIHPCDACDNCQETDGVCILNDDMQKLYPKLRSADAILLASPIYWFTFNAQLKLCIDRWYAMIGENGHELSGKRFGIVLTYGDADPYISGAVNAINTFESMFRYIKGEIVGIVYGSANDEGEVIKQPVLMAEAYELGKKLAGG